MNPDDWVRCGRMSGGPWAFYSNDALSKDFNGDQSSSGEQIRLTGWPHAVATPLRFLALQQMATVKWGIMGTATIADSVHEAMVTAPSAECVAIASRTVEKARVRTGSPQCPAGSTAAAVF